MNRDVLKGVRAMTVFGWTGFCAYQVHVHPDLFVNYIYTGIAFGAGLLLAGTSLR